MPVHRHNRKSIFLTASILLAAVALFSACSSNQPVPPVLPSTSTLTAVIATATVTPLPSPTSTVTPTPTAPAPLYSSICQPLDKISLEQMPQILQYPLDTPHPGQDDGHHGDDFAFYQFGELNGIDGLPIQSVFDGTVAGVANNRRPYGNMIMIETPLDEIAPEVLSALALPTPSPIIPPDPRMQNCPAEPLPFHLKSNGRSLYVLYAHMQQPATITPGNQVNCGQQIGLVGNTGMSGNPHLHLEVRVGPSGARFGSMSYYDPGATTDEYANYCTWRVSQLFQLVDPAKLLAAGVQ